jgi:hypothetical protein
VNASNTFASRANSTKPAPLHSTTDALTTCTLQAVLTRDTPLTHHTTVNNLRPLQPTQPYNGALDNQRLDTPTTYYHCNANHNDNSKRQSAAIKQLTTTATMPCATQRHDTSTQRRHHSHTILPHLLHAPTACTYCMHLLHALFYLPILLHYFTALFYHTILPHYFTTPHTDRDDKPPFVLTNVQWLGETRYSPRTQQQLQSKQTPLRRRQQLRPSPTMNHALALRVFTP